jgi:hypothetical protein
MTNNINIKDATGRSVAVSTEDISKLNGEVVASQHIQRTASTYISGSGSAVDGSQPLTDTQLRASVVPVSVSGVSTSDKQDTLLSAVQALQTAVGLLAKLTDTQPVSGIVTANTGLTQPLTDTQLRASAVNMIIKGFDEAYEDYVELRLDSQCIPSYIVNTQRGETILVESNSCDITGKIWDSYNGQSVEPQDITISASSNGNNTIVAATTGKKIRVLALILSFSAAVNAKFQSGAGGTDKTGLFYGTTNTQIVLPYNKLGWFETAAGALLNLNLSGAVPVGGCLTYIKV